MDIFVKTIFFTLIVVLFGCLRAYNTRLTKSMKATKEREWPRIGSRMKLFWCLLKNSQGWGYFSISAGIMLILALIAIFWQEYLQW